MKKAIKVIAVLQMLAGGFGIGWAVYSIYDTQSIQGLTMLWTVLHFFAVIGGVQLLREEPFGVILSLIFQVPQLVFWETTNYAFRFASGITLSVKYGPHRQWALDFNILSHMGYRSGWGQSQISPQIGINIIAFAITIMLIIYIMKSRLHPSPEQMLSDFQN